MENQQKRNKDYRKISQNNGQNENNQMLTINVSVKFLQSSRQLISVAEPKRAHASAGEDELTFGLHCVP